MFETGQRSAISTSELGLYSDRGDRYNRSRYGPVIRKIVIVVMAVVAVVLTAIFIYDFTSGASATSKVSQETKRIYILQNSLKKPSGALRRQFTSTTAPADSEFNRTSTIRIQDRSDVVNSQEITYVEQSEVPSPESLSGKPIDLQSESRTKDANAKDEPAEGKQLFSNHAVVYRVRQRYKYPDPSEEFNEEEARPAPFHFELKTPHPQSFNTRPKFPQLSQYRYPHSSRNIQDIIKYLTNDPAGVNRGIKFTGVYVNPKKYDLFPEVGDTMANSDRNEYHADMVSGDDEEEDDEDSEEDQSPESFRYGPKYNVDPFYQYKPKHPADVNLLAPSNVRFSPTGTHRYNPYHTPFFQRPGITINRPIGLPVQEPNPYDSTGSYSSGSYGKKRKPKPFSVMLDIYPITDLGEQPNNKKTSRPSRPPAISAEEYDTRRPLVYNRGQRYHLPASGPQPIPLVAVPAPHSGLSDEEEKQQMIFHLNLFPRKKNKLNRNDIIHRSETMRPEDHEKFMHNVMTPFDAITKPLTDYSAIEESKYEESELPETTYEPLAQSEPSSSGFKFEDPQSGDTDNTKEDLGYSNYEGEHVEEAAQQVSSSESVPTSEMSQAGQANECKNCLEEKDPRKKLSNKDIDTPEGFQAFADGLVATD